MMRKRRAISAAGLILGFYAFYCPASAQGPQRLVPTEKLPVYTVCMDCHGPIGDSTDPSVPRLNGQHVEFLRKRLTDFHDPGSQDPHAVDAMWGIVEHLDDQTLAEIADYYSRQPAMPAKGRRTLPEDGHHLYVTGDPANYVGSCESCHGANAEGRGDIPRLAGQHALYLKNQLERMRLNLRTSDVMHPKTNSMTDAQIKALVAYLAGD